MCLCIRVSAMDALQWMGAVRMRVNGWSTVNGCRQNESQWMLYSEWVPSEWESMDALQWMGAIRMRVNGCSAVNGCHQNESQWMLYSEWVPSEWESMDALQWMGAVRMFLSALILTAPIHCRASIAETHFYRSDEETNSSESWMTWGWGHFQQICIFFWTIPLIYI